MMLRTESPSSLIKILLRKGCFVAEGATASCSYCDIYDRNALNFFKRGGATYREHLKLTLINQVFTCFSAGG
jgi:hypothetical protein